MTSVASIYRLKTETLFYSVSYLDSFLSDSADVPPLQQLGLTCLWVACKFEETSTPKLDKFIDVIDISTSKQDIIQLEQRVLNNLQYEISSPTCYVFLTHDIKMRQIGENVKCENLEQLAKFMSELSLLSTTISLGYKCSTIAASCFAMARFTYRGDPWPEDLDECIKDLKMLYLSAKDMKEQATRNKFKKVTSV